MTRETLEFLRNLLSQAQIHAGSPNFREQAMALIRAMDELDAELESH